MNGLRWSHAVLLGAAIGLTACQRKANPVSDLEKTAEMLKDAPAPDAKTEAPATQLKEAIADYKEGKFEDAVTRLQLLRKQSAISPEQRMALQDSVASVMAEIYELAQKGDPKAIAAVQAYERMQNRQ